MIHYKIRQSCEGDLWLSVTRKCWWYLEVSSQIIFFIMYNFVIMKKYVS